MFLHLPRDCLNQVWLGRCGSLWFLRVTLSRDPLANVVEFLHLGVLKGSQQKWRRYSCRKCVQHEAVVYSQSRSLGTRHMPTMQIPFVTFYEVCLCSSFKNGRAAIEFMHERVKARQLRLRSGEGFRWKRQRAMFQSSPFLQSGHFRPVLCIHFMLPAFEGAL